MIACNDCRYYSPGGARSPAKEGTCHRNSPFQLSEETEPGTTETEPDEDGNSILTIAGQITYTGWPDVMAHDWCGEWSPA